MLLDFFGGQGVGYAQKSSVMGGVGWDYAWLSCVDLFKEHFVFYFFLFCSIFFWNLCNTAFSEIETEIDFVHMDDAQRQNWHLHTFSLLKESLGV